MLPIILSPPASLFTGEPYLLRDEFTDTRAAGAVNGTLATPGPGKRSVVDAANHITIDASGLEIDAVPSTSTYLQELLASGGGTQRSPGNVLLSRITVPALNDTFYCGWNVVGGVSAANLVQFTASDSTIKAASGFGIIQTMSGGLVAASEYGVAIMQRASGAFYWVKPSGSYWRLRAILDGQTATPLYPTVSGYHNPGSVRTLRAIYAPPLYPIPVVSDGFSSWGTADGLGHAEGVAGGIGAGGGGKAWTSDVGTWGVASGVASASALTGGYALASVDAGTPDVFICATLTRSAGNVGVSFRYVTDVYGINYEIRFYHDGTNLWVKEFKNNIVGTQLGGVTRAFGAGKLRCWIDGQTFRFSWNDSPENYINTGGRPIIYMGPYSTATRIGLYTTDTGNTFANVAIYPISGAPESLLNRYSGCDDSWSASEKYVIFEGDSLTAGSDVATDYPHVVLASLGAPWAGIDVAFGGTACGDALNRTVNVDSRFNGARAKNVACIMEGVNGLNDANAYYAQLKTWWAGRRAQGFKVVAMTVTPSTATAQQETNRIALNTLIRSDPTLYDALADVGADATIGVAGSQNNTTYYNADKVHMTPAGYAIVAGLVVTAVQSL